MTKRQKLDQCIKKAKDYGTGKIPMPLKKFTPVKDNKLATEAQQVFNTDFSY